MSVKKKSRGKSKKTCFRNIGTIILHCMALLYPELSEIKNKTDFK